jgi:coenzyme F420-reducing hydrogenase gamma subunit
MEPQIIIDDCSIPYFMVEGGVDGAWVEGVVRNDSSLEVRGDDERNGSTVFSWGEWAVSVRVDRVPRLLGFS